jgi:hypothetical protein
MSVHISIPVEEILPWSEETRARFPRHVIAKLTELRREFFPTDNTVEEDGTNPTIGYRHLLGTLEWRDAFPLTTVQLWIASHDFVRTLLWLPGSRVWIKPAHYLFFDPIEPSLLPEPVDYSTLWVVYDDSWGTGQVGIAEITLVAPEQVPPSTWHLGLNIL